MFVEFKQGDEIVKHSEDPVDQEGICWALSMKWLALSLHGKSDEQQGRIGQLKAWVKNAISLQRDYALLHTVSDTSSFNNPGVIKTAGLVQFFGSRLSIQIDKTEKKKIMMTMDSGLGNLDAVAERLRTAGTGHILSFQYPNGKGHAMATRARSSGFWWVFGNETFLFDPNEGECDLTSDSVKRVLTGHFKSTNATSLFICKVAKS